MGQGGVRMGGGGMSSSTPDFASFKSGASCGAQIIKILDCCVFINCLGA